MNPSFDNHMRLYTSMLRVRDLERSESWYRTILDFQVTYRDLGYSLIILTHQSGCTISLWELRPEEPLVQAGRQGSYLVFASQNIEQSHRDLTERGAAPEPVQFANGLHLFWFADPDGHRHCVLQFLPE